MSAATVEGLDWFGAATPPSIWSGSFTVVPSDPTSAVQPSDLVVRSTSSRDMSPTFQVSVDNKNKSRLIVQFVISIGGTFPVILTFRGNSLNPPQGGNWNVYSDDASLSLTNYIPGIPSLSEGFTMSSEAGVHASVQGDMLHFAKTTSQATANQWAHVCWDLPTLKAGPLPPALFIIFRVRWNSLSGTREVKLHIPSIANPSQDECVLLQYWNGTVNWKIWSDRNKTFISQGPSEISANGKWHDILCYASPDAIRIYEDGRNIMTKTRSDFLFGSFNMACQVLDGTGVFDSDLTDFKVCPAAFHHDLPALISTPTELIFNSASSMFNRRYFSVSSWNSPISVTQTENSLKFYTGSLTKAHSTVYTHHAQELPSYSVVQYRFRVNASGGRGTKVTIASGLILRVQDGIPRWQRFISSDFTTLCNTTNFRVGGPYVDVLVIVSSGLVTLFEDGKFLFEHMADPQKDKCLATFHIQHMGAEGELDVELSHLRIVSGA